RCPSKSHRLNRAGRRPLRTQMAARGMIMQHFDAIIIGTGQAGPPLAARLAGAGMKVAIIERKAFGGTCVNTGCIPTKTLVASAYAASTARRAAEYGIRLPGEIAVDMKAVKARKDAISGQSRTGVEQWMRDRSEERRVGKECGARGRGGD